MSSINNVTLVGNLGRTPELNKTRNGKSVCTLSVATNESHTNSAGEREEDTSWHRVVCWGKLAENSCKQLEKGRQLYVEGRIQYRTYEDREGYERDVAEIVARKVIWLGPNQSHQDLEEEDVPAESSE